MTPPVRCRVLAEARSYAERPFGYSTIGPPLDDPAARQALVDPATTEGVRWDGDALEYVAGAAGGYPYFLQEYGQQTWLAATGLDRVTVTDARIGVADGTRQLDGGFFRSRWDRATPSERAYLTAMATDGAGPSASKDIADRLGRTHAGLGRTRANLIHKGLVYAPEHGRVAFTVPAWADFIRRQPA